MADLFDRIFDDDETKIAIHSFRAALGDYSTGDTTRTEIVNYWTLDSEAQIDLDVLLAAIDSKTDLQKAQFLLELHDVLMIAEEGAKYTTKATFKVRLGL